MKYVKSLSAFLLLSTCSNLAPAESPCDYDSSVNTQYTKTIEKPSEFKKRVKEKGASFLFSKNMCLMFLSSFLESSPNVRNTISTEIVRYAASNTEISSFYIKVN